MLFPFIKIDIRSFANYFDKTKSEDYILDNRMIQLSHEIRDSLYHHDPQNSQINIDQNITNIDGFYLQRVYSRIIDEKETHLTHLHAIFQDDLVCTYDENDKRAHARPIICGSPSIISIAAVFEGPAKPKGYYFKNMLKDLLSMNSKEIQQEYSNRYVSYDDPRLVHVLTGYVIQAIFFFLTNGNPFCSNYPCRLYNSHWQEELIYTQVINPVLCKEHLEMLAKAKE